MPGIYEANTTSSDNVPSEAPVQSESMAESVEPSSTHAECDEQEKPSREIDQTDKINKFLLKSFLQHINNDPIPAEAVEELVNESDGEWEWQQ